MKTGTLQNTLRGGVAAGLLLAFGTAAATGADYPELPELNWEQRSDWINVKTGMEGIGPAAVGDGVADDTEALQAAFDRVREPESAFSTVYLPPGTYRITKEIYPQHARHDAAMHLRGHGRSTRIVWHGPKGGRMFRSDSAAYSTYIGVVWDGRGIAAQGFMHDARTVRETKVLHQHQAFMNFTEEGSGTAREKRNANGDFQVYLEGSEWRNCLFINCGKGLVLWDFNDYVITIDSCEFHDNGYGVWSERGQFFVRNSHFRRSRQADIVNNNDIHACSARRVTSVGSRAFYERGGSSGTMFTMQDCHLSGWTDPDHAVRSREHAQSPMLIFDCTFTDAPSANPPIRLQGATPVVHSNNRWSTGGAFVGGKTEHVREVPQGKRGGAIASAQQRFFKSEAAIPAKVFDAKRDFGARADGRADDTDAVQSAIDAARQHGKGAIAYLPRGRYRLSRTVNITGGDYYVGGAGAALGDTSVIWGGDSVGPIFLVADPRNVTLENLAFLIRSNPATLVSVRQVNRTPHPSRMHYEQLFVVGPLNTGSPTTSHADFEVVGLSKGSVLTASGVWIDRHLYDNSCSARILLNHVNGHIAVKGTVGDRTGFLGVQVSQSTFLIEDNHSIVGSDSYVEQAKQEYARLRGSAGLPEGRVTLSSPKLHTWKARNVGWDKDFIIEDYRGTLASVMAEYSSGNEPQASYRIVHTGSSPFNIVCMANSYRDAAPTFNVGSGVSRTVLACAETGKEWKSIDDIVPNNGLQDAAGALDHFRELGEHDLEINHGIVRRDGASR